MSAGDDKGECYSCPQGWSTPQVAAGACSEAVAAGYWWRQVQRLPAAVDADVSHRLLHDTGLPIPSILGAGNPGECNLRNADSLSRPRSLLLISQSCANFHPHSYAYESGMQGNETHRACYRQGRNGLGRRKHLHNAKRHKFRAKRGPETYPGAHCKQNPRAA